MRRSLSRISRAAWLAQAASVAMRLALPRYSRPSGVSSTRRLVRENSAKPSLRSNSRIRAESAGCDTFRRDDARVKESSSATVTKMR